MGLGGGGGTSRKERTDVNKSHLPPPPKLAGGQTEADVTRRFGVSDAPQSFYLFKKRFHVQM